MKKETIMQKRTSIENATARKYPEPVVLVTTHDPKGSDNVMAVGWTTTVSYKPRMLLVAIDDAAYTYELIRKTKEFVVAFPSEKMAEATLYAGTHHGRKTNKIRNAGLAVQKAWKVRAPLVRDAVANFECKLVEITRPGDCPMIVGRVVAAHENKDGKVKRLYYSYKENFALSGIQVIGKR
jgi:flavin reductase (DIM6/NTAB) family NADH-FMN oxidoreductase RutF